MYQDVGQYRLGPFHLASEIPLPELKPYHPSDSDAWPDAFIRFGPVPERLEGVVANETRWWATRDQYLNRVPGVANFLVSRGREIIVEPAPESIPGDIRAYLLSILFSVLCYQAGMYSLHASAVRVDDGIAAFLGNSGAGKSTLAAWLSRRNFPVVSDDICLLDPRDSSGPPLVIPVAPALKLWRTAIEHLGTAPGEMTRVYTREDKYRLEVDPGGELDQRLPLRAVYFLEWTDDPATPAEFVPIEGVLAVTRLMEFNHFEYLMKPTGRQQENFLLCGRILSHVRAFILRRPRNFKRIDSVVDALVGHLSSP